MDTQDVENITGIDGIFYVFFFTYNRQPLIPIFCFPKVLIIKT